MRFDESRSIVHQDALPKQADVVVIGGGIAGICTAYYLSKTGVSVFVCEKGRVAGEQSSRNWGWIRQQGRDPDELPLAIEANRLWDEIAADLDEDIHFTRTGVLFATNDEKRLASFHEWLKVAEQHQLDTRLLSGSEANSLLKGGNDNWIGGLITPSDARAEPFTTVPAIARAVSRYGGLIRENCAVRGIALSAGRVSEVITEHGPIKTNTVLCAGGAWSSRFLRNLGISLPQLTVKGTVVRTAPAPDIFPGAAAIVDLGIRRRKDGGYTIATGTTHDHFVVKDSFRNFVRFIPAMRESFGTIDIRVTSNTFTDLVSGHRWRNDEQSPFERTRILNPAASKKALKRIKRDIQKWVPALSDVPFEQAWAGMIDTTPDVVPVLDQIESHPGLFVATGFSGHGFGIGPATGRIMADMVQGKSEAHNLSRFRFARFHDGSRMVPGPGI